MPKPLLLRTLARKNNAAQIRKDMDTWSTYKAKDVVDGLKAAYVYHVSPAVSVALFDGAEKRGIRLPLDDLLYFAAKKAYRGEFPDLVLEYSRYLFAHRDEMDFPCDGTVRNPHDHLLWAATTPKGRRFLSYYLTEHITHELYTEVFEKLRICQEGALLELLVNKRPRILDDFELISDRPNPPFGLQWAYHQALDRGAPPAWDPTKATALAMEARALEAVIRAPGDAIYSPKYEPGLGDWLLGTIYWSRTRAAWVGAVVRVQNNSKFPLRR